ncbi:MAG TPA: helix-turn-helix domain-containing protein [Thermomicrobiales bacterium]|nr:helix-turn-helix domain-containing protein [Thermomicrobiales bacterium]
MPEERTLFTTAEAAAMLGISHVAVKSAAYNGTLAVVRVNPRLNMVTREAIEDYRRDHLGRVGRPPRKKKARKSRPAPAVAPDEGRARATGDAAAHDTGHDPLDEGDTTSPATEEER